MGTETFMYSRKSLISPNHYNWYPRKWVIIHK